MTKTTYDPEADAIYIKLGKGEYDHTEEAGPFIYDVDDTGRVLGIEILGASTVLAPGDWQKSLCPGARSTSDTERQQAFSQ